MRFAGGACWLFAACTPSAPAAPPSSPAPVPTCDATNLRPRIVGIRAIDLSTFAAHASRDVVIVRYDGCSLEILDACRDESVSGRVGAYKPPARMRADDRFQIHDEAELRARLPLATPELVREVSAGFDVVVLTRGLVEATRDRISRAELPGAPECTRATHFVFSFEVGAFRIRAADGRAREAGRIDACDAEPPRDCRVPISVTLRALE
jgi:hypothetical protein